MGEGISPYAYMFMIPQDEHEHYLLRQLEALGVTPEWNTTLTDLSNDKESVGVTLRNQGQEPEEKAFSWVIGCDGANSFVRRSLGMDFSGETVDGVFFVSDVSTAEKNEDAHMAMGRRMLALMMPVRTSGHQRIMGVAPGDITEEEQKASQKATKRAAKMMGVTLQEVHWSSTYRVHHRVADRFRVGRCFLAGDAGHIHSPVGGQGMNTGIGDAMNLGWKLGHVVRGLAPEEILMSYEPERIAFARALIRNTRSSFANLTSQKRLSTFLRMRIMPLVVRVLSALRILQKPLFRAVSQTMIHYRESPLSERRAGGIVAGERLPWVSDPDTHEPLDGVSWSAHSCGELQKTEVKNFLQKRGIVLHAWPESPSMKKSGYLPGALYLVRPDGYVGLAQKKPNREALESYLSSVLNHRVEKIERQGILMEKSAGGNIF